MTKKERGRRAAVYYRSEAVGGIVATITQSDLLRYSDRRGVLADALDDAGFPDAAILCRSNRPVAVSDAGELFDPLTRIPVDLLTESRNAVQQQGDMLREFVTSLTAPPAPQ